MKRRPLRPDYTPLGIVLFMFGILLLGMLLGAFAI